ncbi:MAG: hypothetical protein ABI068_03650, partial [Ktedonobacterales bacterium]
MALKARERRTRPPVWPLSTSKKADGGSSAAVPGVSRRSNLRRFVKGAVWTLLTLAMLLAGVGAYGYWRVSQTVTSYAGAHFNQGHNAVWLEHTWVGVQHSEADYDALANQLEREQVAYVFAHVGPLTSDGSIPDTLAPFARAFADAMHTRLPNLKVLAW